MMTKSFLINSIFFLYDSNVSKDSGKSNPISKSEKFKANISTYIRNVLLQSKVIVSIILHCCAK